LQILLEFWCILTEATKQHQKIAVLGDSKLVVVSFLTGHLA